MPATHVCKLWRAACDGCVQYLRQIARALQLWRREQQLGDGDARGLLLRPQPPSHPHRMDMGILGSPHWQWIAPAAGASTRCGAWALGPWRGAVAFVVAVFVDCELCLMLPLLPVGGRVRVRVCALRCYQQGY